MLGDIWHSLNTEITIPPGKKIASALSTKYSTTHCGKDAYFRNRHPHVGICSDIDTHQTKKAKRFPGIATSLGTLS